MTETHPLAPLKTVTLGFDVTSLDDDVVSSDFALPLVSVIGFGDTVTSSEFELWFDGTLDGVSSILTLLLLAIILFVCVVVYVTSKKNCSVLSKRYCHLYDLKYFHLNHCQKHLPNKGNIFPPHLINISTHDHGGG